MKDPAMLLYTSDFLTETYFMDMAERGQYITLICLQQQHGHLTMSLIEQAVGPLTQNVKKLFVMDEEGKYYNERADYEIARRKKYSKSQSNKAGRRWRDSADGNAAAYPAADAAALPIETETETETEIESESEIGSETETGIGPGAREIKTNDASPAFSPDEPAPGGSTPREFTPEEIEEIHRRIKKVRPNAAQVTVDVMTMLETDRLRGEMPPDYPDIEHFFQADHYRQYLRDRRKLVWPITREHLKPDTPRRVLQELGLT